MEVEEGYVWTLNASNKRLHEFCEAQGFTGSVYDTTISVRGEKKDRGFLSVYVDDVIVSKKLESVEKQDRVILSIYIDDLLIVSKKLESVRQ